MEKTDSGTEIINKLLQGGYEKENITTIYGPRSSGKTNLCLLATIKQAKQEKNTIYIDTGNNFSIERLKQLTQDYKKILPKIIIFKPKTFQNQEEIIETIKKMTRYGLIIIDPISTFYRLELGEKQAIYETNILLGKQIAALKNIAKKEKIPIIITSQVYDNLKEEKITMVGGKILRYGSNCIIELKNNEKEKKAILKKHPKIKEKKEIKYEIKEKGIIISQ